MVDTLAAKTCTPCKGGIPPLTPQEAEHFRVHVPQWEVRDEARRIERTFRLRNFAEAFALVQQVGVLAEAEGHHPDISFGWGYVTVVMQTKKIKGLHENDFIMAAKIDRLSEPVVLPSKGGGAARAAAVAGSEAGNANQALPVVSVGGAGSDLRHASHHPSGQGSVRSFPSEKNMSDPIEIAERRRIGITPSRLSILSVIAA